MTNEPPKQLTDARKSFARRRDILVDQAYADVVEEGHFDVVARPYLEVVETARKITQLFEPAKVWSPSSPWKAVDREMRKITLLAYEKAQACVERAAASLKLTGIETGFPQYPKAGFRFRPVRAPGRPPPSDFAPLITVCLDDVIYDALVRRVITVHTPHARDRQGKVPQDLYRGEDGVALMEIANRFLAIEARLWHLAQQGGLDAEIPYPTRYEAARFLWSPRIRGAALCLRCGSTIQYQRAGRSGRTRPRRLPICDPCYRSGCGSGSFDWPKDAIMPAGRGTWWLLCQDDDCSHAFVGPGQAHFCHEHRSSRQTASRRRSSPRRRS